MGRSTEVGVVPFAAKNLWDGYIEYPYPDRPDIPRFITGWLYAVRDYIGEGPLPEFNFNGWHLVDEAFQYEKVLFVSAFCKGDDTVYLINEHDDDAWDLTAFANDREALEAFVRDVFPEYPVADIKGPAAVKQRL